MEERVAVTLDITKCRYIGEVFREIRTKMHWEDWYGENLYAVWDVLTGLPHYGDDITIRRPYKYTNIPYGQNESFTKYVDKICEVFQQAEQTYGEITVRIEYCSE